MNQEQMQKRYQELLNKGIDLDISVNIIITYFGIRKSFLFEPRNYNEEWNFYKRRSRFRKQTKCMEIYKMITNFGGLKTIPLKDQGILVMNDKNYKDVKKKNKRKKILDIPDKDIAELLSFPKECYGMPDTRLFNAVYCFTIMVKQRNEEKSIITVMCGNNTESIKKHFNDMITEIEKLKLNINNEELTLELKIKKQITHVGLIQVLKNNEPITNEIIHELCLYIVENVGLNFTKSYLEELAKKKKDIVIFLLLYYIYICDNFLPFLPIQPEQNKIYQELMNQLSEDIKDYVYPGGKDTNTLTTKINLNYLNQLKQHKKDIYTLMLLLDKNNIMIIFKLTRSKYNHFLRITKNLIDNLKKYILPEAYYLKENLENKNCFLFKFDKTPLFSNDISGNAEYYFLKGFDENKDYSKDFFLVTSKFNDKWIVYHL
jgi:hypothetical protein